MERRLKIFLAIFMGMWLMACTPSTKNFDLEASRKNFKTQISYDLPAESAPNPPPAIFSKITYPTSSGSLVAYLSTTADKSTKHPAIIWITGGDCNSIGDVWSKQNPSNDQTASAYREAGIVMMFPSLRGGNDNPGKREGMYGEVDDILAAYGYLVKLPYVDAERIYLGGHSTGGTLVLLTAETRNPFRAVFSFGPVESIEQHSQRNIRVDFSKYKEDEVKLRSPVLWLDSAKGNIFVIEGAEQPGNNESLDIMKKQTKNPALHFFAVSGKDHFSVLAPSNTMIAAKILADQGKESPFTLHEKDFNFQ